jgi:hypothetical protein
VKWRKSRRERNREKAAKLAPPEERTPTDATVASDVNNHRAGNGDGSIVVDTRGLNLPKGFGEESAGERKVFGVEPVVLAILILALAFIAFIAYLIYIGEGSAPTS